MSRLSPLRIKEIKPQEPEIIFPVPTQWQPMIREPALWFSELRSMSFWIQLTYLIQFTLLIPCFEMKIGEPNICLVFLILWSSETQVIPGDLLERDQRMFQNMSGLKSYQSGSFLQEDKAHTLLHLWLLLCAKGSYLILIDYFLGLQTGFFVLTTWCLMCWE